VKFRYAHPPNDPGEVVAIQDNYSAKTTLYHPNCRNKRGPGKESRRGELEPYLHAVIAAAFIIRIAEKINVAASKTNGVRGAIHHGVKAIAVDTVETASGTHGANC
jgi:hypothetical protein